MGQNHTRILSKLGVLVAICDANPEKSKEYGEKYSVNHYQSLEALEIVKKICLELNVEYKIYSLLNMDN